MTAQTMYNLNCQRSIDLCTKYERFIAEVKLFEELQDWENHGAALMCYNELKIQLDEIWSEQVELYDQLQPDDTRRKASRIEYYYLKEPIEDVSDEKHSLILNIFRNEHIFDFDKLGEITETDPKLVNKIVTQFLIEKYN